MKKKIRIYSSLVALTFLSTSILCACTNTDTSTAAKTDQSRFYFHAQKRQPTTKEQIFILIATTIFGHGILFIQITLILVMPFCRQRNQNP